MTSRDDENVDCDMVELDWQKESSRWKKQQEKVIVIEDEVLVCLEVAGYCDTVELDWQKESSHWKKQTEKVIEIEDEVLVYRGL